MTMESAGKISFDEVSAFVKNPVPARSRTMPRNNTAILACRPHSRQILVATALQENDGVRVFIRVARCEGLITPPNQCYLQFGMPRTTSAAKRHTRNTKYSVYHIIRRSHRRVQRATINRDRDRTTPPNKDNNTGMHRRCQPVSVCAQVEL